MDNPIPDSRIADYIAEISEPGIPYVSGSHLTLQRLYGLHGSAVVTQLIEDYFAARRAMLPH